MPSEQELLQIIKIQSDIAKLGRNLGEVMNIVTERTLTLLGADGAAIELAEGDEMVYRATAGVARGSLGLRLKRQESLSGACVTSGETLRCDDSELDIRADREACRQVGIRSMIVMPLRHGDATVGVLKAMAVQTARFSDDDVALLRLLSDQVAAAMYFAAQDEHHEDLFYRATHDQLTGLANRALFMDRLRNERTERTTEQGVGVLMIDMDGLKEVNDNFGHRAGDAVLKAFAERCKAVARSSDTVARLGGDEFGVILSPAGRLDGVAAAVERIQAKLTEPFEFENRHYRLAASIGAALFPDEGSDIEDLLHLADQRMYAVKRQQRNTRSAHRG